jgi:3-deoxy-7-phosphoheptulonate synthase
MTLPSNTDDLRILELRELATPADVIGELPRSATATEVVTASRAAFHEILAGRDGRLAVVIGPCSIHDPAAALEYARRIVEQRARLGADLEIIMRVYFEKPRTTVGWKGLINDPHLDGTFAIDEGLRIARKLLCDINEMGVPAAVEFLDVFTPQYLADLVAWGAIGARTTESQVHRELASGLSCPIGFKNGTDGGVQIAVDAVNAASHPHHFLAITKAGRSAIASTAGNKDCHVVLRGGKAPNHDAQSVAAACATIEKAGLPARLMIDASHANSRKDPKNQPAVVDEIAAQVAGGDGRIVGVMVESHLVAGRQDLKPGQPLTYGQSITDGCIDWDASVLVLDALAAAVRRRRAAGGAAPAEAALQPA